MQTPSCSEKDQIVTGMQALHLLPSQCLWPFEIVGEPSQIGINLYGARFLRTPIISCHDGHRLAIFLAHLQDNTVPLTTKLSASITYLTVTICRGAQTAELFLIVCPAAVEWLFQDNVLFVNRIWGFSQFALHGQTVSYLWGVDSVYTFDLFIPWQRDLLDRILTHINSPASKAFANLLDQSRS